jgi:hypothetical protein
MEKMIVSFLPIKKKINIKALHAIELARIGEFCIIN